MKNVTFIIGNGFDIKLGLKTRYSDFYKVYKNIQEPNPTIMDFKKNILNENEIMWRDFEYGMGQCEKFNNPDDYIRCYQDVASKLDDYLLKENHRLDLNNISTDDINELKISLYYFHRKVKNVEIEKVKEFNTELNEIKINLNVIQFNYTTVFDKLFDNISPDYGSKKGLNLHVHGKIGGFNHAMGVNDTSQIKSTILKNNSMVIDTFVKPNFHSSLQSEDVNQPTDYTKGQQVIKATDTFCIFGCSIGNTDKFWWEQIGKRLINKPNTHLIIFDVCDINTENEGKYQTVKIENINKKNQKRKEIIGNFLRLSGLGEDWAQKNKDRIFVELNTSMFNQNIPKQKNIVEFAK